MRYNVYVRRLPLMEWEDRKDHPNIIESELKLYAILESLDDVQKMWARFKKRAEVLHIKLFVIPYGKNNVVVTFYVNILGLYDIIYDPFTFDINTVHRKPNKPEILDTVKLSDGTTFLIATHSIEEFIELCGLDSDFSIKNLEFSQKPDFTVRTFENPEHVVFMNKMKDLLNHEGIIISVGVGSLTHHPINKIYAYIILLYTDKPYDDAFETFKCYSIQIEEDMKCTQ